MARRPKLVDKDGRFLVPIVYRLRTPDGEPWEPAEHAGQQVQPPACAHCGQPLPLVAQPDTATVTGSFLLPVKTDTREQTPYTFEGIGWDKTDGGGPGKTLTIETVRGTLASGDYSLAGYERRVAVERKSLADWYGTLGKGRDRFERELERLRSYDFAAVVIEASLAEMATAPPPHTELNPKTVYRTFVAWSVRYPVKFVPCDGRRLAEITTFRLLERWLKEELGKEQSK
jgi:DNA excision repair protein ERCC-4